jgi:protein-S-isoprenylcysteine O-methyltransferase Ste14
MAVRWANVPIPETYVAALIGSALMHAIAPIPAPLSRSTARLAGWPLLAGGVGMAAWAVVSAGEADVERDSELVTAGVYAVSRNPMYVGWSAAVLGLATIRRDPWLLAAWLLATRAIHDEVLGEEARLAGRFGDAYRAYRRAVPRYLTLRRRPRGPLDGSRRTEYNRAIPAHRRRQQPASKE